MNPVFFGSSKEPLYGVYHPPKASTTEQVGVVICAPAGVEDMRTHRALQKLGSQLAKSGVHAFRFDYFGTGDSAGPSEAGTPDRWIQDVRSAISELHDTAKIASTVIVGLRLGAVLGAAAAKATGGVDRAVYWDPVVDGKAYVAEQLAQATPGPAPNIVGVQGFPLTADAQDGIRSLRLDDFVEPGIARQTLLVVSKDTPEYLALTGRAKTAALDWTMKKIESAGDWDDLDRLGAALLPQQIIQGIVSWISGREQS